MTDKYPNIIKDLWPYVRPIDDFNIDPANAMRHKDEDLNETASSLHEFKQRTPIVVNTSGGKNIIEKGNGTWLAAKRLGWTHIAVVGQDDDPVTHVRYGIADNATGRIAKWDVKTLDALLQQQDDPTSVPGVTADLVDAVAADLKALVNGADGEDTEPQVDLAAELAEEWGVELGQVWQLGEHRLAVGDCTDKGVVEAVMGEDKAGLMVTDPPYGVNYDPKWRAQNAHHFGKLKGNTLKSYGQVSNDDTHDWTNAYQLFKGDIMYVWHADQHAIHVAMNLEKAGFTLRSQIIWRKPNFVISRGNYHYQHEPCWYAVRKGKTSNWQGDRMQSTVWDIASLQPMGRSQDPLDERTGHGTQKPIECMARPIRNNSVVSDLIYDPFLGSGTTLIAAENLGRRCRACEIDPGYVAVTLQRYLDHSGVKPELID